jgi:hypothetical protein
VSVTTTWHILRLWKEKIAYRYGYMDMYNRHRQLVTINVQGGSLAKTNNSQNPAGYSMRSPVLWDVAPHLSITGTQPKNSQVTKFYTGSWTKILWENLCDKTRDKRFGA